MRDPSTDAAPLAPLAKYLALPDESKVIGWLAERYAAPEYAFFPSVRNATGFQRRARTADAVAMSLWPSRGLELHGFEVKVSRADWLREKRDPAKAEEIARFMDRWWIAAGERDIVKPDELPPTWGLLVPRGGKLVVAVEAPKLEPQPITRAFLAAIFQRAIEVLDVGPEPGMVEAEVNRRLEEKTAETVAVAQHERDQAIREAQRVQAQIDAFDKASGIKIGNWNGGELGAAVRYVLKNRKPETAVVEELQRMEARLKNALAGIQASLAIKGGA